MKHSDFAATMPTTGPSRFRADSLGSLCGPPQNTPAARSLVEDSTSLNLDAVNEDLASKTAGLAFGEPTLVPANTPATLTPPSYYRSQTLNLPGIEEAIELLPPALTSVGALTNSSPSSPDGDNQGEHGIIPITLGSPRSNTPKRLNGMYPSSQSSATMHSRSPLPPYVGGVREFTDWHDDIEQDVGRDLTRLCNLADDDHKRDPSQSAEQHYRRRLSNLLNSGRRKYVFGNLGEATRSAVATPDSPVKSSMVTAYEFQQLSMRVDTLESLLNHVLRAQSKANIETAKLRADMAGLAGNVPKEET